MEANKNCPSCGRKEAVLDAVNHIFDSCPGNIIPPEIAISPEAAGIALYDRPLVGFGSAADPLFESYKQEGAIGPWYMTPEEWLPGAKTVISIFFPSTEEVKASNRPMKECAGPGWIHGRAEGQRFISACMAQLQQWFTEQGIACCVPSLDPRFQMISRGKGVSDYACANERTFGSNWSERHAGYVCGLGTFGLSKGLITEKGMAGRMGSIIIAEELNPDQRAYSGLYDNCTMCGACVRRCPTSAISLEKGKDHVLCSSWLNKISQQFAPRYGCGLCQTAVPCESRNPKASH